MAAIKGTNVIAPVVPLDTTDVHPSHEARYGKGGYRTVATLVERDAIPAPRREAGMLVYVSAGGGSLWQLGGDLTTWTAFESGGNANLPSGTDGDVLTYLDGEWVAAEPQGGVSSWNDLTDRPTEFPPESHAASHLVDGGSDPIYDQDLNTINSAQFTGLTVANGGSNDSGILIGDPPNNYVQIYADPSNHTNVWKFKVVNGIDGAVIEGWTIDAAQVTGLGTAAVEDTTAFAAASHQHSYSYADITDPPDLSVYATTSSLATVATSGAYADLSGLPTLGTAAAENATAFAQATHGHVVADITDFPTLFDGAYSSLTGLPTLGTAAAQDSSAFAAASHGHAWSDITSGVPSTFAPSAHAASHLHGAADAIFNQNLNTTDAPTFVGLSLYNTTAISEENSGPTLVVHSGTDQSYHLMAVGMKYVDGTPYGLIQTYGNSSDVPGVRIEEAGGRLTALWCKSVAFDDSTVQTTAWPGTLSYTALTDLPTLGTAAAEDATAFAAASHAHAWSDITSGVPSTFAPSAHKASHATGGSDALTAADIGAAAASHTHTSAAISDFASAVVAAAPPTTNASLLTQGTLSASRLPTSGVGAGTYTSVTVDTYGRVTAGSTPSIAYSSLTGLPTLGGAASLNVGTTAGTVAAGDDARLTDARTPTAHNQAWSTITSTPTTLAGYGITDAASSSHTHAQLHDRSHAITSTSDHTATAWRLFYSDASGAITELTLGSSGQALLSNGASAAPSWGLAGTNLASDLTTGTLAYARMADPTVTSPSQITASQNDYTGFARGINRFSTNAARDITGMAAGADGEIRVLCNVGTTAANTLTIKDESASSTAANRFSVPWNGDCVIPAEGSVVVFYDNTSQRWRVI